MKKIYFLTVLFLSLSMALLGQSSPCPLQIHLERTIGASNTDYKVYYYVDYDYENRVYLVLDAYTESFDTTLLLGPDARFRLSAEYPNYGWDFVCRITDGSGYVFEDNYFPEYNTVDPCTPSCPFSIHYGSTQPIYSISEPQRQWLTVYAENEWGYGDYLESTYNSSWTEDYEASRDFFAPTGKPLLIDWTNPDPTNNSFYFYSIL